MSENAKSIAESMFGVFGKKAEEIKVKDETGGGGGIFFNPDAKSAPNKIYRAVIKFLPKLYDLENPNKTETVETVSYWVPEGTSGFRYTSPKSLGKMEKCLVADKFWEWKESSDARLKTLSGKLGYKRQFFALIQVIEDYAKPENKGKIFIYDVPYSIQKKMNAIMYPSKEDMKMGQMPNNIFDPLEGCPLILKVSIKDTAEGEFRDYDSCEFTEKLSPRMIVDTSAEELVPAPEPKTDDELMAYKTKAIETILAGPSLKEVEFKPLSEDLVKRVKSALENLENGNTGNQNASEPAATKEATTTEATKEAKPETKETENKASETDAAADLVAQVMGDTAM